MPCIITTSKSRLIVNLCRNLCSLFQENIWSTSHNALLPIPMQPCILGMFHHYHPTWPPIPLEAVHCGKCFISSLHFPHPPDFNSDSSSEFWHVFRHFLVNFFLFWLVVTSSTDFCDISSSRSFSPGLSVSVNIQFHCHVWFFREVSYLLINWSCFFTLGLLQNSSDWRYTHFLTSRQATLQKRSFYMFALWWPINTSIFFSQK